MISRWLERGLGSVVAPDENFAAKQPPADDGYGYLWRIVAPVPVYEEKAEGGVPSTPGGAQPPPEAAFLTPGFNTGMDHIQCIHCKKTTPIRSPKPANDGFKTPSPVKESQADDDLEKKVIDAAKGFAHSMNGPVPDSQKVFRLCASSKPLQGNLLQKLEKMIKGNESLIKTRAANMGQLVPDGFTPLMATAHSGNVGAAKIILKLNQKDAHLDRDFQGRTPLHIAAAEGNFEVVEALRETYQHDGIDPGNLLDLNGRTPFGLVLTSPNPKARKNQQRLGQVLFSPEDKSVFGVPRPPNQRQQIYRSIDMVYGESEIPGFRVTMEDAICSAAWLDDSSNEFYCLLGVCDGHGDQGKVSKFVAEEIAKLMQTKQLGNTQKDAVEWQKIWTEACLQVDQDLKNDGRGGGSTASLALITKSDIVVANVGDSRCILVQCDANGASAPPIEAEAPPLVNEEKEPASTDKVVDEAVPATEATSAEKSTTAAQEAGAETEEEVAKAEAPPKETVSLGYACVPLSEDHKPNLPGEKERVEKAGMTVTEETFTEKDGQEVTIHKVQKNSSNLMAVSRSFGDFEYKANKLLGREEQAIIAVPDVRVHPRSAEKDMYLVVACDGVWDVMSSDEVAKFIIDQAESIKEDVHVGGQLPAIGDALLKECLKRGSRDNMTVAVCALSKSMEKFAVGAMKGKALKFEPKEQPSEGQGT